jgi:hypothetical protein
VDDLDTWGHVMDDIDTSTTFRIILQNPNGIQPGRKDYDFQYSLANCHSLGMRVLSLVDTKLNWTKETSYHTANWFHKIWNFSSISHSQINESFNSSFQPGGILTAVVDRWTSRVHSKHQDPYRLGRWSFVTLRGKQDTLITVISAYRVSQKSSSSLGVKTAYMQLYRALQAQLLEKEVLSAPEPNKQFILDLQAWVQHLQVQGHQIILNLDNNEDLYNSGGTIHPLAYNPDGPTSDNLHNGSLWTLAMTCGLIDILAIHHSERPFPPTYIRGKKHIDYMLLSASLQESVVRSGILPYCSIFAGDHRPYFLDLNANILFAGSTSPIAPVCYHSLQLSDPRRVGK